MVFSSAAFLFAFLPLVLLLYFIVPGRFRSARNMVLLVFSLIFYFYGEPKGILIMLLSITANYIFAMLIEANDEKPVPRRIALILSVVFNLGILGYYKYTGFFLTNIQNMFGLDIAIPKIIMPIGISFFTFQGMSYVFDVYQRTVKAQRNILNVALYISMFPQLVAGPIVRYETIENELTDRTESLPMFYNGLCRFIIGMGKKMLLANCFGSIVQDIGWLTEPTVSWAIAWAGAIAYTFQIYYDFSAYSDMAIGLGQMLGFRFLENFDYPYISRSITEFWRRWHMSLSVWFRDYVYIPLGGSRKGKVRQIINIAVVWALTGFWHGASWNFILWGMYFAVLLIAEKLFLLKALDKVWKPLAHIYALFFIVIGWVIFNSASMPAIVKTIGTMFSFSPLSDVSKGYVVYLLRNYTAEIIAGVLFSMPVYPLIKKRFESNIIYRCIFPVCILIILALSLVSIVSNTFNPFIYFRF